MLVDGNVPGDPAREKTLPHPDACPPNMTVRLSVALGEYDTGWHSADLSVQRVESLVTRAAERGAKLVVLPEMATTGFTMDTAQAVTIESVEVDALRRVAREHATWLIAGVALREAGAESGVTVNAALVIDTHGNITAVHRKQRLFAFAGEDRFYAPGNQATVVDVDGVRVALFICYDLRFPELFRAVASRTEAMVVIANWPAVRRAHWDTLLAARAIENQCVVIGVNRTGSGDGIVYDGGSRAFDAWGDALVPSGGDPPIVVVDTGPIESIRATYPFLRDAR